MKKRKNKLKRKYIKRKLLLMLHKCIEYKGEAIAKMNGII